MRYLREIQCRSVFPIQSHKFALFLEFRNVCSTHLHEYVYICIRSHFFGNIYAFVCSFYISSYMLCFYNKYINAAIKDISLLSLIFISCAGPFSMLLVYTHLTKVFLMYIDYHNNTQSTIKKKKRTNYLANLISFDVEEQQHQLCPRY